MHITVLNGSPKGPQSITLQTIRYIEKKYPAHEFEFVHVGQRIHALEKDMKPALDALTRSDLVLFAYPVYTFIAPYQLHRFMERLKEESIDLSGKFAAQITTSKHFFDMTAHRYIEDNLAELSLQNLGVLSADMDDLLTEKGRAQACSFWEMIQYRAENHCALPSRLLPSPEDRPYTACLPDCKKKSGRTVCIVTNCASDDESLQQMMEDYRHALPYPTYIVNIGQYPFAGGCLGCFHCARNGQCVYHDGFDTFLREKIQTADAIVYAFTIRDHSMGASFKCYDDRQFCNGHRTVTMGKPTGYIIRGAFAQEENLRTIIEGRSAVGGNPLVGIATDEANTSHALAKLATMCTYALEHPLQQPSNFYGVGGMKIFRDLIYVMRGFMRADHRFYKQHGFYDFPQNARGTICKMQAVGILLSIPTVQKKMGKRMNDVILGPYEKVVHEA